MKRFVCDLIEIYSLSITHWNEEADPNGVEVYLGHKS